MDKHVIIVENKTISHQVCLSAKSTRRLHALEDGSKEETDEEIFRIEEVTSVEGQGKQVIANLVLLSNTGHSKTEVKCQLGQQQTITIS